jgi:hypothetical protein
MTSVCGGFLYVQNFNFLSLRCIMRYKKFLSSCSSFSVENFMDDCKLTNSLSVCSMFFFSMRLFVVFLWLYICVHVSCAVYMFQLILRMLGHPWITRRFVYSTAGQISSSFVPSLFAVSVSYISGYSCCRSQWLRSLRHEPSSPARTLGSWVRIPLKAWISVCFYSVFMLFCV